MTFDLDHAAVGVVFSADHPLLLTDDVKFKFYCSNVGLSLIQSHITHSGP